MTAVRPSITTRGQGWIRNFADDERPAATLLLDSLDLVSSDDVRLGLLDRLKDLPARRAPAALIPVRGLEDLKPSGLRHVAYETFHPKDRVAPTPGSEALVGSWIRELVGERPGREKAGWLHPSSPIERLAEMKCRLFVLVTDYSGSGKQVLDFARIFVRNKTIRSWRSLGWIKIVVVAYAMSEEALVRITGDSSLDELHLVRPAPSFSSAQWTRQQKQDIEGICTKYLKPHEMKQAFGFGESGGLFAIQNRVPNNVPIVLRRKPSGWYPFFEARSVPQDLVTELGTYLSERELVTMAYDVRQQRLGKAMEGEGRESPTATLVTLLALLLDRQQTAVDLAFRLNRPLTRIEEFLSFLRAMNLTNDDLQLTPAGLSELRAAKRLKRVVTASLESSDTPYYPQQLR